ncbi:lipoate--protein ligase family protein [Arthrobacter castelli]|uniref:lipoate--protein ligase family protein n=1 Tax=Arthrobacter castelli TaxID=271431 RepID=UPI00041DD00E|nr:lipoate--protein ligase [Arthrobacter castelli]
MNIDAPRPPGLSESLSVINQQTSLGAVADLEHAITMLHEARAGQLGPSLRFYIPQPTVAFGQRDTRLPGFEAARQACLDHGFTPMVRRAGGRAAAYHQGCLVLDHIEPHSDAIAGSKKRFAFFARLLATALGSAGVDAGVGEIPGEYCPGEYTVHGLRSPDRLDTALKLVGTAQRVVSGAWLFSSSIVVADSAPLRAVLADVYAALDLEWNPATAGAAEDLVPGLGLDAVKTAILSAYAAYAGLQAGRVPTGG